MIMRGVAERVVVDLEVDVEVDLMGKLEERRR